MVQAIGASHAASWAAQRAGCARDEPRLLQLPAGVEAHLRLRSAHIWRRELPHSELEPAQLDDIAFRQPAPRTRLVSHHQPQLLRAGSGRLVEPEVAVLPRRPQLGHPHVHALHLCRLSLASLLKECGVGQHAACQRSCCVRSRESRLETLAVGEGLLSTGRGGSR